ncbi:hypothetical protein CPB84DRAFT_1799118 [Gymnopilus junonius]|uniref:Uncharacterized protein n=1 Tax=Gymnopilus junonius TaxID=109634 RepID=A0A9P5N9N5_GYMJU|nr:hypothetical protein CPB84DRAFT_1799118 [Gymnopilus junonius]
MDGYEYDGLGFDDDENDSWRRSRGMGSVDDTRRSPVDMGPRGVLAERDNLKWPVGEGWKPL